MIFESAFRNNSADYFNVRQAWKKALSTTLFFAFFGDYMLEVLLFNGPDSESLKQTLRTLSHLSGSLVVPLLLIVGLILVFFTYVSVRSWIALISSHKLLVIISAYFALMQLNFLASTRFAIAGGVGRRVLINAMLSNIYTITLGLLFAFPLMKQASGQAAGGVEVGPASADNSNAIETIENDADI